MRNRLEVLLEQLKDSLPNLMHAHEPCNNAADYKCAFCHKRPNTNLGEITHADNCLGEALECELNEDVKKLIQHFGEIK